MVGVDRLTALVEPVLEGAGAELVDLELAGSRGRPVVRVFVDAAGGISLDDCARLSRRLEAALESAAAVPERYVLEVSSPGLQRPLRTRAHFERFADREIEVRLYAPKDGRKRFVGRLQSVRDREDGSYAIEVAEGDGTVHVLDRSEIAKARLHVSW